MHRYAGALSGRVETGNHGVVVGKNLCLDVRGDAAHGVVRGGHDGHGLIHRVNSEVSARELSDVGKLGFENLGTEVRAVEEHVVLVGAGASSFNDLLHHAAGDDVARREVFDGGGVALHEALTTGVAQDGSLAACTLGEQDAQAGQAGGVELVELHVFERDALAPHDAHAVAREGVCVGGGLVDLAETARGENDCLGLEHVNVSRGQLVGHDTRRNLLALFGGHHHVEHVELVVELDAVLHAVLKQGLQNHVTGAVGGVARATNGRLAVVAGVSTKTALVDLALGRAVEGQTHVLEVDHRVDGLSGQNLGGILVDQVVATLHGVERVPLPAVFLDVGECRGHSTLRGTRVRTRGVQLGDHCGLGVGACLNGGAHAGSTGTHNHDVVFVVVNAVDYFGR